MKTDNDAKPLLFKFDSVHDDGPSGRQEKVYEDNLAQIVTNFTESYQSASVLLFGPSGSGKTYTLKGGQATQDRGLAPRAVESILEKLKNKENFEHTSNFS